MHPVDVDQLVAAMDQAAARFTETAAVLQDPETALREIVTGAVDVVPGAVHAGITTLHPDGRISSNTPSAELVARLDHAQAVLREGPCVDAIHASRHAAPGDAHTARARGSRANRSRGGEGGDGGDEPEGAGVVHVADLGAATDRWPRFAAEALRNGVFSMLSFQLSGRRSPVTALNLYAEQPGAFDLVARTTAALFADQAAIALHGADHAAGLNRALDSRDVIGQAKGILMERHRVSAKDAFGMLVEASQHTNIKLREVADWLVADLGSGRQRIDPGR